MSLTATVWVGFFYFISHFRNSIMELSFVSELKVNQSQVKSFKGKFLHFIYSCSSIEVFYTSPFMSADQPLPAVKVWNTNMSQPVNLAPMINNDTMPSSFGEIISGNFAILLISLITAMVWVLYITYYNSRVIGYVITRLLTKFYVRKGYLKVGQYFQFTLPFQLIDILRTLLALLIVLCYQICKKRFKERRVSAECQEESNMLLMSFINS